MDEQRKKKLADKLEAKAQRNEEEIGRRKTAAAKLEGFHNRAGDVFEKIVEPEMEECKQLLAKSGRQIEVKQEGYQPPSLTLYVFQPGLPSYGQGADFIRFRTGEELDVVFVEVKIVGTPTSPAMRFLLSEITEEKVGQLLADFVERIADS